MTAVRSLLRELFAAGDAGDVARFSDLMHEDVVVHAPFGLSTTGLEAEIESWRRAVETMPTLRHEFQMVMVDDESEAARCVVTGALTGTYGNVTGNGTAFRVDQAIFARIRDGKIAELWEIVDTEALMRQLKR